MGGNGRKILVVLVLAVVVYAGFLFSSDVNRLMRTMTSFHWWTFFAALGLAFGNYLVRFLKWQFYLRRLNVGSNAPGEAFEPLPWFESFTVFIAGFVMSITPGKAGEVFRSALLLSSRKVPIALTAPIVIADRLSDLVALILLVTIGSILFPGYGWVALIGAAMVGGVLVLVVWSRFTLGVFTWAERFALGKRLVPKFREAYVALRTLSDPLTMLWNTALSVFAWSLECLALWVILQGLGIDVTPTLAFFAYATATIAGALAMLPGGLGATEYVMEQILRQLGHVNPPADAAATLLVRFATLWFAVIIGGIGLVIFRRHFDRAKATSEADMESR